MVADSSIVGFELVGDISSSIGRGIVKDLDSKVLVGLGKERLDGRPQKPFPLKTGRAMSTEGIGSFCLFG